MKKILICFICFAILAACTSTTELPLDTQAAMPSPSSLLPSATSTPMPDALWINPAVPPVLSELAKSWDIPIASDPALATQKLDISDSGSMWIYALVAPFPTVADDVAYQDLLSTWKGVPVTPIAGHSVLLAESTLGAFTAFWGEPASGAVRVV